MRAGMLVVEKEIRIAEKGKYHVRNMGNLRVDGLVDLVAARLQKLERERTRVSRFKCRHVTAILGAMQC